MRAMMGGFVPAFAGYAERVRDSFARQGAMALIGASIVDVAAGYCSIALVPRPEVAQQHGYVHAGILATLVVGGRLRRLYAVPGGQFDPDGRVQAEPAGAGRRRADRRGRLR